MSEFIKRSIYTSIGAAVVANEKLKELVEDLLQNQPFTEDEGKRIVDTFLVNLRTQIDTVNGNVMVKIDGLLQKMGWKNFISVKQEMEEYVEEVKKNPMNILRLPQK